MTLPRHTILLLLLLLSLSVCRQGFAVVRESPVSGPSSPITVIDTIAESGIGLPATLESNKDVYLVITVNGIRRGVFFTLAARKSVDPHDVGRLLEKSARYAPLPNSTVYVEEGSQHSEAFQNASPGFFLSRGLNIQLPIGRMVSSIESDGFRPHVLLRTDEACESPDLAPSSVKIGSYHWHNMTGVPSDTVVNFHIPLPWSWSGYLKAVGLMVVFPLLAVMILLVAIKATSDERMPPEARRKRYTAIYAGGISLLILCFTAGVFVYWEGVSRSLFEQTSSGIATAIYVVPVMSALMLIVLAVGWMIGQRIVPPKPEEQKELFPLLPMWWMVMMLVFQVLFMILSHRAEYYTLVVAAGIFVAFVMLWSLFQAPIAWWWIKKRLALCEIDEGLAARGHAVARKIGVSIKDVRIDPTEDGRTNANARVFVRQGYVVMARKSLDAMSPEHLDWLLAHEIAHVKHGSLAVRSILSLLVLVICLAGVAASVILGREGLGAWTAFPALILLLGLVIAAAFVDNRCNRVQELAADREALIAVGDLRVAQEALRLLAETGEDPEVHERDTTHPSLAKRLAALESSARELGLVPTDLGPAASETQP